MLGAVVIDRAVVTCDRNRCIDLVDRLITIGYVKRYSSKVRIVIGKLTCRKSHVGRAGVGSFCSCGTVKGEVFGNVIERRACSRNVACYRMLGSVVIDRAVVTNDGNRRVDLVDRYDCGAGGRDVIIFCYLIVNRIGAGVGVGRGGIQRVLARLRTVLHDCTFGVRNRDRNAVRFSVIVAGIARSRNAHRSGVYGEVRAGVGDGVVIACRQGSLRDGISSDVLARGTGKCARERIGSDESACRIGEGRISVPVGFFLSICRHGQSLLCDRKLCRCGFPAHRNACGIGPCVGVARIGDFGRCGKAVSIPICTLGNRCRNSRFIIGLSCHIQRQGLRFQIAGSFAGAGCGNNVTVCRISPTVNMGRNQASFAAIKLHDVVVVVAEEVIGRVFAFHIGRPAARNDAGRPRGPRIAHSSNADLCRIVQSADDLNRAVRLDKQVLLDALFGIKGSTALRIVVVVDLRIAGNLNDCKASGYAGEFVACDPVIRIIPIRRKIGGIVSINLCAVEDERATIVSVDRTAAAAPLGVVSINTVVCDHAIVQGNGAVVHIQAAAVIRRVAGDRNAIQGNVRAADVDGSASFAVRASRDRTVVEREGAAADRDHTAVAGFRDRVSVQAKLCTARRAPRARDRDVTGQVVVAGRSRQAARRNPFLKYDI